MAPTKPTQTILVVEDDDATSAAFSEFLTEHGYKVSLAPNGQEALDYLRDYPAPDLIILDMFMPRMDGWQFLKQWGFRWTSIPVLIATAMGVASEGWYFIKATGVAEHVRRLTLGPLRAGKVHVLFQGVRRKNYSNVEPAVIDLEGDCQLD